MVLLEIVCGQAGPPVGHDVEVALHGLEEPGAVRLWRHNRRHLTLTSETLDYCLHSLIPGKGTNVVYKESKALITLHYYQASLPSKGSQNRRHYKRTACSGPSWCCWYEALYGPFC